MVRSDLPERGLLPASRLLAVFLAAHGVAHFAGTLGNAQLVANDTSAELFGGAMRTTDAATLIVLAAAWAALGVTFITAAVIVWRRMRAARRVLTTVTVASLTLSVASLWAAGIGVAINIVLLAGACWVPSQLGLPVSSEATRWNG